MQKTEWNDEFLRELNVEQYPKYPNEAMLKVIFGSYLSHKSLPNSNWRTLDIGCAMGSNLIPFADLGCDAHGIDIHDEIAKTQREYYLNEQLKAIQKELGDAEDGRDETAEIEDRIKETKLSKEAREKANAELKTIFT